VSASHNISHYSTDRQQRTYIDKDFEPTDDHLCDLAVLRRNRQYLQVAICRLQKALRFDDRLTEETISEVLLIEFLHHVKQVDGAGRGRTKESGLLGGSELIFVSLEYLAEYVIRRVCRIKECLGRVGVVTPSLAGGSGGQGHDAGLTCRSRGFWRRSGGGAAGRAIIWRWKSSRD
jgi:hypothetical protein